MVFADMLLYVKLVMLLAKHFMDSKLLGSSILMQGIADNWFGEDPQ